MIKRKLKNTEIYALELFQAIFNEFEIKIIDEEHKNDFIISNIENFFELEAKSDLDNKYQKTIVSCIKTSKELETLLHKLNGSLVMVLRKGGSINNIKKHVIELINNLPDQSFNMSRYDLETYSNSNWSKLENLTAIKQIFIKIASCKISKEIDSIFYNHTSKPFLNIVSPIRTIIGEVSPISFNEWLNSIIQNLNHDLILNRSNHEVLLFITVDSFYNLSAAEFLAYGNIENLESPKLPIGYKGLIVAGVDGDENLSGLWFENGSWKVYRTNLKAQSFFN